MEILETTLTSKFQFTLPKRLRELFRLGVGDRIAFLVEGNEVVLVPKPANILKALKSLGKGRAFPEIRNEIRGARREW